MLLQQQLAEVGITIDIRKVDPSQWINYLIEGDYELGTVYWTNDIIDPDQKTAFTLIGDDNRNFFSNWTSPPGGHGAGQAGAGRAGLREIAARCTQRCK